jgi:hypothetical protein
MWNNNSFDLVPKTEAEYNGVVKLFSQYITDYLTITMKEKAEQAVDHLIRLRTMPEDECGTITISFNVEVTPSVIHTILAKIRRKAAHD